MYFSLPLFIFSPHYDPKNDPLLRSSTHPNAQMHSPSPPPIRNATSQALARLARWREHATNGANCIKEGLQLQLLHTTFSVFPSLFGSFLFVFLSLFLSTSLILLSHLAVSHNNGPRDSLFPPTLSDFTPTLWVLADPVTQCQRDLMHSFDCIGCMT